MEKRQRLALLGMAAAIAIAAVVIALAAGGGDGGKGSETKAQPANGDTPAPTQTTEPDVTRIRVENGEPVGGAEEISAEKGETVRIDVTSDTADELHLHVYDIKKQLKPGKRTRLKFKADVEGVVELELHSTGTAIAEITVEP